MDYKGFRIKLHDQYSTYVISRIGKGGVPNQIQGAFTSPSEAMKAIDRIPAKRGTTNAKSVETSGS